MTVYYDNQELIIINELVPADGFVHDRQTRLVLQLGRGVKAIYLAHEIWLYNPAMHIFSAYKNRGGNISLLKSFLADKGINVKPDAISTRTGQPSQYHFVDDKDLFLFNLKFGK